MRWALAGIAGFVSTGALYGGTALLVDAEAFGMREEWLDGSPFGDYRLPGLFLLVVIGFGSALVAMLAALRHTFAAFAATVMGTILIAWLSVETAVIGFQGGAQVALLASARYSK